MEVKINYIINKSGVADAIGGYDGLEDFARDEIEAHVRNFYGSHFDLVVSAEYGETGTFENGVTVSASCLKDDQDCELVNDIQNDLDKDFTNRIWDKFCSKGDQS